MANEGPTAAEPVCASGAEPARPVNVVGAAPGAALPETTMDLTALHAIVDKLEASKAAGWLSEYLVAWHGRAGKLSPQVTVWRPDGISETVMRRHVARLLAEHVGWRNIVITQG